VEINPRKPTLMRTEPTQAKVASAEVHMVSDDDDDDDDDGGGGGGSRWTTVLV
jgi:hypothetical protein